jgi:hypothetical protein
MNCILIGSPDKISLNNFVKFLKKSLNEYRIGVMHSLMSANSVRLYMEDFLEKNPKAMFTYYAKRKVGIDPLTCFPTYAQERADVVIWFDLYSTEPKLVKDRFNVMKQTIKDWNKYIESISGNI